MQHLMMPAYQNTSQCLEVTKEYLQTDTLELSNAVKVPHGETFAGELKNKKAAVISGCFDRNWHLVPNNLCCGEQ